MILSDLKILEKLSTGDVSITPFDMESLGSNSYDLKLGGTLARYDWPILDVKRPNDITTFQIPEDGYELKPNTLYLGSTMEAVGVHNTVCATLMGKSSLARLGLDIHICGGFIDTGFEGNIVLEIRSIHHLVIYPNMKIAQIKFERVDGVVYKPYNKNPNSKYNGQEGVVGSKMWMNKF